MALVSGVNNVVDIDLPSPISNPDVWDRIVVKGVTWEGKFEIKGAKQHWQWDQKHGRATEGSSDSYVGAKPEPFEITFFLWTDAHFARWPQYSALFQYQGSKGSAQPTSIYHPTLAVINIAAVTCLELGSPESSDGDMYTCKVKLRQFRPQISSPTISPKGAATAHPPSLPGPPPNPVVEALQAQIAQRRRTIAALGTPGGLPP